MANDTRVATSPGTCHDRSARQCSVGSSGSALAKAYHGREDHSVGLLVVYERVLGRENHKWSGCTKPVEGHAHGAVVHRPKARGCWAAAAVALDHAVPDHPGPEERCNERAQCACDCISTKQEREGRRSMVVLALLVCFVGFQGARPVLLVECPYYRDQEQAAHAVNQWLQEEQSRQCGRRACGSAAAHKLAERCAARRGSRRRHICLCTQLRSPRVAHRCSCLAAPEPGARRRSSGEVRNLVGVLGAGL